MMYKIKKLYTKFKNMTTGVYFIQIQKTLTT